MGSYCEDCGCKVYSKRCTNCHEVLFIEEQYYELNMPLPDDSSDFMKQVVECHKNINKINNK